MKSRYNLTGKYVIVFGGGGYLGFAISKGIVENGGNVIIADLNPQRIIDKLKLDSAKHIDRYKIMEVDCTSQESLENLYSNLGTIYSNIDGIINTTYPKNANYGVKFDNLQYNDFIENVGLHLGSYFLTNQKFGEIFKNQGYGNIINISSIYGTVVPRFSIYKGTEMTVPVEYALSKAAIIHLTKYLAKYYEGSNIRVNCISPGGILANQPKSFLDGYRSYCLSKGMLEISDITGVVNFLLSDDSKYINGQNIIIDDGFSL